MKGNYKVGDLIPEFKATLENGHTISSDKLKGKKTIIFFYPKDDTPTCTKEACNLRDNYKFFTKHKYAIYGISPDSEKRHLKFKEKYSLPYSLIADPDKDIINKFGYFGPKIFMGKEVEGVYRTTIVLDEETRITHIIEKVVSGDHSKQLAEAIGL